MSDPTSLRERLSRLGKRLGQREAEHAADLAAAQEHAHALHQLVSEGLEAFHAAATESGAGHLQVTLSQVRTDDKHLRAVEFDLTRGRHRAIITVKSKGQVTLVGPFHQGKTEGPCKSFPFDAEAELAPALESFLESFLEEAATP